MREVYLAPFEHAVQQGAAWSVMAAYNQVDDGVETSPMTDHHHLLTGLLKEELGFDGAVCQRLDGDALDRRLGSRWARHRHAGPRRARGSTHSLAAVRAGEVPSRSSTTRSPASCCSRAASGRSTCPSSPSRPAPSSTSFITEVAVRSTVVLQARRRRTRSGIGRRRRASPSSARTPCRPHVLGGGSSTVHPPYVVSPEQGLARPLPRRDARGPPRRRLASLRARPRPRRPCRDRRRAAVVTASYLDETGAVFATRRFPSWDGWLRDLPEDAAQRATARRGRARRARRPLARGRHRRWTPHRDRRRSVVEEHTETAGVEVILELLDQHPGGLGPDGRR